MLDDSNIIITGGTGSFGRAFARKVLTDFKPRKLIIFSRDELKQSEMAREFAEFENIRFLLGDVRDKDRVKRALSSVDFVIHAAALKQVPAMEYNPTEAIKTNIDGTVNVVEACVEKGVQRAVFLSSDKSCMPVNFYGATKMCGEKVWLSGNAYSGNKVKFSAVRYGNVIGSRGSVIPLFLDLKARGIKKFKITSLQMTRFWLTIEQAVTLVLFALYNCVGGEICVPYIPSMKLVDLAKAIDPECEFDVIGMRPGEKLHEILASEYDTNVRFVSCRKDLLLPSIPYTSDTNKWIMSAQELRQFIGLETIENE